MTALRPAVAADAPALAALTTQLGYPATAAQLAERIAPLLESTADAVLVAVDGDEAIGWIHVGLQRVLEASRTAVLHGLVIDEAHRSAGVGRELLGAAESWAAERGCETLIVRSRVTRERAHRFYEREGYRLVKTSHVFAKPLV